MFCFLAILVFHAYSSCCEAGVIGGGWGGYPWNGGYGPGPAGAKFGHGFNAYGPAGAGPLCGYEPCSDTFGRFPFKYGRYPTGGAVAGIPPGSSVGRRGFREGRKDGIEVDVDEQIQKDKADLAVAMQELNEETVASLVRISQKLFAIFNSVGQESLDLTEIVVEKNKVQVEETNEAETEEKSGKTNKLISAEVATKEEDKEKAPKLEEAVMAEEPLHKISKAFHKLLQPLNNMHDANK